MTFNRPVLDTLLARLREPRRFIQVLAGPRQVGKTTLALQALDALNAPSHYASADEPTLRDSAWISQQWEVARIRCRKARQRKTHLVLDEVHKVKGWSETVKARWDEDTASKTRIQVVLLGSSHLLVERGLSESLAGRFEMIPVTHWSLAEMNKAFGWNAERYVYFGGYPGAAPLVGNQNRWSRYIIDSLIETTVSRDILLLTRVDKPALLRRLFQLGCDYSGQILSYTKMLGQLQDAGNTTTLAHYLDLLSGAGMLAGLPKFSGKRVRQRASSPKLLVWNTALMSALSPLSFAQVREAPEAWGRWVESTVGAHLLNGARGTNVEVFYWRDRNREVDFVLRRGNTIVTIEVKTGRRLTALPGMDAFASRFKPLRSILVGPGGMPLEEFLCTGVEDLL
jgi:predicted AAA+ superfamily ATPase